MPTINLRKYYPFLNEDCFVEVSDEISKVFLLAIRQENNYRQRTYRHKAYYSLDRGDGIENSILHTEPSPEEILMQKVSMEQLYEALDHLPPIQARRVYAHYILGMKKVDIARAEGVNSSGVCDSVRKGVRNLRRYFEKKKWME
ncbi:RNA polymerase sigma factor [Caproicibacter fermentans]|uniref:Sigma-70 family RNA polymerase sigma factor n=1 Tax=Caproicibacter fermentans TaxID=2576756 RepID=A0A7G8T9I1_9FIRM|nr:sigma-70 family RNA polymerase sigma factor [Caproicibacter fermentans]QNK40272.1 sigma-70 family RNA polymerase sigma factor [Caproicibacter fermentans]